MSGKPPLIDPTPLQACSGGDAEFEQELLALFVIDSHDHLVAVKAAITDQDFATLRREAHHIKGASGNVGVHRMQTLAQALEHSASAEHLEHLSSLVVELEETWAAVAQEVKTWSGNYSGEDPAISGSF